MVLAPLSPLLFADMCSAGRDQSGFTYTVSLTVHKPHTNQSTAYEHGTGYLDDSLFLSFGSGDDSSHFIMTTVDEVLKDHDMCEDLPPVAPTGLNVQRQSNATHKAKGLGK
jgi:hypothetical protein